MSRDRAGEAKRMRFTSGGAVDPQHEYPDGWAPGNLPEPPRGPTGETRWLIALVALAAVATLVTVLVVAGDRPGGTSNAADPSPSARTTSLDTVASARDTGPITIVTEDVTCDDWGSVATAVSVARSGGWDDRDPRAPASAWNPELRTQFKAVGDALRTGADTAVTLAVQTPHRAMRGLYEAFIVYGRGYADSLLNYQPVDDSLAQTSVAAMDAITYICGASRSSVASAQESRLEPVATPSSPPVVGDPAHPKRFLPQSNKVCDRWMGDERALLAELKPWSALDPDVAIGQLKDEQISIYADAARTVSTFANRMESAGRGSANPTLEDFATLGAVYLRAYSQAISLIWAGDHDLIQAAFSINRLVTAGCRATAA